MIYRKSFTRFVFFILTALIGFSLGKSKEAQFIELSYDEVLQAMVLEPGYDIKATTNVPRFQAGVLLRLARKAYTNNSNGNPLYVSYAAWSKAYLKAAGLDFQDAPVFIQLAFNYQQSQIIEYGHDKVLSKIKSNKPPAFAIKIKVEWPDNNKAEHYSFDDTLSVPKLKVTNHRIITYYLFDYGGWFVFDNIKGISGRPTTGILGLLFKLIGEGRIVHARIAFSNDGLQISTTHAKKGPFKVNSIVTVYPTGRMQKDIPAGREDLHHIVVDLKEPLNIEYLDN